MQHIFAKVKDLYAILECNPSDSTAVIKRNYRKLAQQYHPDKNPNDKYAAAHFHEIKEAYEILISPTKKEIWLQERWLHQVMNKVHFEKQPLTPYTILLKILNWEKSMYMADSFRINLIQCEKQLDIFLSNESISCIQSFNEPEIQQQIIIHLTRAIKGLPYTLTEKYHSAILKIADSSPQSIQLIQEFMNQKKREKLWGQWKLPLIIITTGLICFFIMKMSH